MFQQVPWPVFIAVVTGFVAIYLGVVAWVYYPEEIRAARSRFLKRGSKPNAVPPSGSALGATGIGPTLTVTDSRSTTEPEILPGAGLSKGSAETYDEGVRQAKPRPQRSNPFEREILHQEAASPSSPLATRLPDEGSNAEIESFAIPISTFDDVYDGANDLDYMQSLLDDAVASKYSGTASDTLLANDELVGGTDFGRMVAAARSERSIETA